MTLTLALAACSTNTSGLGALDDLNDAPLGDTHVDGSFDDGGADDTADAGKLPDDASGSGEIDGDGGSSDATDVLPDGGGDTCAAPSVICSGKCVDESTDPKHCGSCTTLCAAYAKYSTCAGGSCGCPDSTKCAAECKDTLHDPTNCATCGTKCPKDQKCGSGGCVCRAGLTSCKVGGVDTCVDILGDGRTCGKCGGDTCTGDNRCTGGSCSSDACPSGRTACDTAGGTKSCFDLQDDSTHCGACGTACEPDFVCVAGACKLYHPAVGGCSNCNALVGPGNKCCSIGGINYCVLGSSCPGVL